MGTLKIGCDCKSLECEVKVGNFKSILANCLTIPIPSQRGRLLFLRHNPSMHYKGACLFNYRKHIEIGFCFFNHRELYICLEKSALAAEFFK
jgi:hypothetical protein